MDETDCPASTALVISVRLKLTIAVAYFFMRDVMLISPSRVSAFLTVMTITKKI
jgi:hypothetical protein